MGSNSRELSGADSQTIFVDESSYSGGPDQSDYRLIERIASGNELAMHILYTRHKMLVYRFALRLINNATSRGRSRQ